MSHISLKRIFSVIQQKSEQKFWQKRNISQPSLWTFLEHFLSQNFVLTCNIYQSWRKRILFLDDFLKNFMIKKKRKNLVAMFYVFVRSLVLIFVGFFLNPANKPFLLRFLIFVLLDFSEKGSLYWAEKSIGKKNRPTNKRRNKKTLFRI